MLRLAAGYPTPAAASRALGKVQSGYGVWEKGERFPKLNILLPILRVFDASLTDLETVDAMLEAGKSEAEVVKRVRTKSGERRATSRAIAELDIEIQRVWGAIALIQKQLRGQRDDS